MTIKLCGHCDRGFKRVRIAKPLMSSRRIELGTLGWVRWSEWDYWYRQIPCRHCVGLGYVDDGVDLDAVAHFCAYCGWSATVGAYEDKSAAIQRHIVECDKHPMAYVMAEASRMVEDAFVSGHKHGFLELPDALKQAGIGEHGSLLLHYQPGSPLPYWCEVDIPADCGRHCTPRRWTSKDGWADVLRQVVKGLSELDCPPVCGCEER